MSLHISTFANNVVPKIETFISEMRVLIHSYASQVVPKLLELAQKVQNLWIQLLPYAKASIRFCGTPIGISIIVIGLATIPLKLARSSPSRIASIAWLTLGILTAGYGAFLLSTSGVIPSLSLIKLV